MVPRDSEWKASSTTFAHSHVPTACKCGLLSRSQSFRYLHAELDVVLFLFILELASEIEIFFRVREAKRGFFFVSWEPCRRVVPVSFVLRSLRPPLSTADDRAVLLSSTLFPQLFPV